VIPTYNRKAKLNRCLESLAKSDYPNIEIVVVDDSSNEDVGNMLSRFHPTMMVLRNTERRILSYSRNAGALHSTGDFLFFLDNDNVVAPETVGNLVRTLSSSEIAVASPVFYFFDAPTKVWISYIRRGAYPRVFILGTGEPRQPEPTFSFHDAFMVKSNVFQ
jgi:glycosyltransferase involved in cell wall biosynthesis